MFLDNRIAGQSPHLLSQTLVSNKGFVLSSFPQRRLSCQASQTGVCQSSTAGILPCLPGHITTDSVPQRGRPVTLPLLTGILEEGGNLKAPLTLSTTSAVSQRIWNVSRAQDIGSPLQTCPTPSILPLWKECLFRDFITRLGCPCRGTTTLTLRDETHEIHLILTLTSC